MAEWRTVKLILKLNVMICVLSDNNYLNKPACLFQLATLNKLFDETQVHLLITNHRRHEIYRCSNVQHTFIMHTHTRLYIAAESIRHP